MNYSISRKNIGAQTVKLHVPGSKSESNRLLVLKHLYAPALSIKGLSSSRDTKYMLEALAERQNKRYVGDAGTVMRFLTAVYAVKDGQETHLYGTDRMHQRPIGILAECLKELGADIEYLENHGFPPLKIKGKRLQGGKVALNAGISSQYVSALMMVAPNMQEGLEIELQGDMVSKPYIQLTASLMEKFGLEVEFTKGKILVKPHTKHKPEEILVEPDWSSASYWYLIGLLTPDVNIELLGYKKASFQGDAAVATLFEHLGVSTVYDKMGIELQRGSNELPPKVEWNLVETPDLAQTLTVALAATKIKARISGLQTLKIKETDRLLALKTELEKTGALIEIDEDSLEIKRGVQNVDGISFETWEDHRMAMSLAPLAVLGNIIIKDADVVNKSYPGFWADLKKAGFLLKEFSE